jgi:uncharacterized protein
MSSRKSTDGSREQFNDLLKEGVELFNAGDYMTAHDKWEILWREASGDVRQLLQALIQLAAGYIHMSRGTLRGAPKVFDGALERLEPIQERELGIDIRALVRNAMQARAKLEGIPTNQTVDPGHTPEIILLEDWHRALYDAL